MKTLAFGLVMMLAASLAGPLSAQTRSAPEGGSGLIAKPTTRADGAMVVAAHPLAAKAGAAALAAGGSAVDAGIAAQLALNVVEPQSSGVGGGGFALHWDAKTGALSSWDGRETAPAAVDETLFLGPGETPLPFLVAVQTGRSVGAPGLPRLLEALHRRHGALPWARNFDAAIALAEGGFDVSPRLATLIARYQARLSARPETAALFFDDDKQPLDAGDRLKNPELAGVFRRLAAEGATAFYEGEIAAAIVAAAAAPPGGGALSAADLSAYQVVERAPICFVYRARYEVCGMGPPSSGATTVGQIMGLASLRDDAARNAAERAHLFLEASRLAYADRAMYLADPTAMRVPATALLAPDYLARRAALLDLDRASPGPAAAGAPVAGAPSDDAPAPPRTRPGTTHVTVVDFDGNVLSLTSSIEGAFGSGRMARGFLLNNQLTDFAFAPERDGRPAANRPGPGKRPRSSMAPTIVFERTASGRRPVLALGSPGGSRIPEYVARAAMAALDRGLDPAAAAAEPNLSHRNRGAVEVERGAAHDALAAALEALGHPVARTTMTSGLHIVAIDPAGGLAGGADPRREGIAIGLPAKPAAE